MAVRLPDIFNAIKQAETNEQKIEAIRKYSYDGLFKRVLLFTYSPVLSFGLSGWDENVQGLQHGLGISKFLHVIDDIIENKFTHEEAIFALNIALKNMNSEEVDIFKGILNKKQDIDLDIEIINAAIPGLIPDFPRQQLRFIDKDQLDELEFPVSIQECYPGMELTIIIRGNSIQFRNTDGSEIGYLNDFIPDFSRLAQEGNVSIEGCILKVDESGICEEQPDSFEDVPKENIKFIMWDIIKNDRFFEGEDTRLGYNWRMNGIHHMMLLAAQADVTPIYDVPVQVPVKTKEEVLNVLSEKMCIVKSMSSFWKAGTNEQQVHIIVD